MFCSRLARRILTAKLRALANAHSGVCADAAGVLQHRDIAHIMISVFNTPVAANDMSAPLQIKRIPIDSHK